MEKTQRMLNAIREYKPTDDFVVIHYTGPYDTRESFFTSLMRDRRMPKVTAWDAATGKKIRYWPGMSPTDAVKLIKSYRKSRMITSGFRMVYRLNHTDPKVLECIQTLVPEECREEV